MRSSRRGVRRRIFAIALAALALTTGGTALAASGTPPWKAPPFAAIGIATVQLSAAHRSTDHPAELVAFVETGTLDTRCLATLNELAGPLPRAVFCAERNPTIDGTSRAGVWLHIFFDEAPDEDLILNVNVYQEGAKRYGSPVRCGAAEGC